MEVVGLGSFLLVRGVFSACAWGAWRGMERDSDMEPLLLGLAGALLGAMVGGLIDHFFLNLDFPHSVSLFWLYAALTVVTIRISEELGGEPEGADAAKRVSEPAFSL